MGKFNLIFEELRGQADASVTLTKITEVEFKYDSPDEVKDKASRGSMTIIVKGEINEENDGETLDLINDWVKLEGQEKGAYCKVTLDVFGADERYLRQYMFPQAFVVDYSEHFDTEGDGKFQLLIRQRQDKLSNINIDGSFKDKLL
ncbi:hypothetical protein SAMN05880501_105171 [Ureibacillus xyleni]|uniref:Uncharacterized protein n=1 Tax=Ureibacillus xyleni TaxID=614648 RepID=A0A285SSC4_9BACL|nr:hypothetical protein [Ureibacillus xyleni]SOC09042.1 hypothetical protein SAMN05880501_105171 [Ureibacillus xyleni]